MNDTAPLTSDSIRQWAESTAQFLAGLNAIEPDIADGELMTYLDAIVNSSRIRQQVTAKLVAKQVEMAAKGGAR
jgi:broad specificity phosphatase PhoE